MNSRGLMRKVVARAFEPRRRQFAARRAVLRAALRAAHSADSDEDARKRLQKELKADPRRLSRALAFLSARRDRFDMDRAYRLLHGAVTDAPVQPSPVDRRDLFSCEEKLGRLPLGEAFAFLAERQPMLHQFERAAGASNGVIQGLRDENITADGDVVDAFRHVSVLLGPGAQGSIDSLLRSQLALSIASQHLAIVAGTDEGDDSCSYFASSKKRMTLSSGFDRR
jgi:hypothetical protein